MKINQTSTALSLILRSLDTSVAPAAQTPEAQAALHVIKLGLLDLLKRQGPSIPILVESIETGEALEREIKSHLASECEIGASAIESIPENLRTFEVLKDVYDELTERLNNAATELSQSNKGSMTVEPLLRKLGAWEGEYTSAILGVTATPFGDDPSVVPSAYEAALRPLTSEYLARFLTESRGHPVEVVDFIPVTGGFGKQTFKATLKHTSTPNSDDVGGQPDEELFESIIIRKADPQPIMLHSAFRIESEYAILRSLANAGFPSPRPIELCISDEIDGPFFTMNLVLGAIPSSFLDNGDKASAIGENVLLQMAEILAKLHATPLITFKDFITSSEGAAALNDNIGQRYRRNVASWKRYMETSSDDHLPSPFLTWLFHWLEANIPEDGRTPVLTHGDYAPHNVLVNDGKVTGVLDWEGAEFSAPEQDLAYIKPHVAKHLPWSTFLEHYTTSLSKLTGRPAPPVNERLFKFGAAYSCMRTYLGGLRGQRNIQKGLNREIRYLMVEFGFAPMFIGMGLKATEDEIADQKVEEVLRAEELKLGDKAEEN